MHQAWKIGSLELGQYLRLGIEEPALPTPLPKPMGGQKNHSEASTIDTADIVKIQTHIATGRFPGLAKDVKEGILKRGIKLSGQGDHEAIFDQPTGDVRHEDLLAEDQRETITPRTWLNRHGFEAILVLYASVSRPRNSTEELIKYT